MGRPEILGAYHSDQGGRLYLNLTGNLENQSMPGTYLHEISHAWLAKTTMLGFLQNIMQMEALSAQDQDAGYSANRRSCARLLVEQSRHVQEVFANNIELLTVEEELGREEMLRALRQRPEEYQSYYLELLPIHQSGMSFQEKRKLAYTLCAHALDASVPPKALQSPKELGAYLKAEGNPDQRLARAAAEYRESGALPPQSPEWEEIKQTALNAAKYTAPYIEEAFQDPGKLFRKLAQEPDQANAQVQKQMMQMTCLFDPAMLRVRRSQQPVATEGKVFFALSHVLNLLEQQNFYLICWDREYLSEEVTALELDERLKKCSGVCTLFSEYDGKKELSLNFEPGDALLAVLFQTSGECSRWLSQTQKRGTVYVGELCANCRQTGVSLLFFCLRGEPQTLFVFPTLSPIRDQLLKETGLASSCLPANDMEFLKLFSHFKDEIGMLKFLQSLLSLLLGRSWSELSANGSLSPLVAAPGRALGNSALRIKRPGYYKILAALPPKNTKEAPLYALMRFEGERNTGDTYTDGKIHAPLLFPTEEAASLFAGRHAKGFTAVGVDKIYWPYLRQMVQELTGKAVLVLDWGKGIGKLADIDDISSVWYP